MDRNRIVIEIVKIETRKEKTITEPFMTTIFSLVVSHIASALLLIWRL